MLRPELRKRGGLGERGFVAVDLSCLSTLYSALVYNIATEGGRTGVIAAAALHRPKASKREGGCHAGGGGPRKRRN